MAQSSPRLPKTIEQMLAAVPQSCGNAVLPAIDDGPVVHPGAEDGADGAPDLLHGIVGEVLAGVVLDRLLELLDQFLSWSTVSSESYCDLGLVLDIFEDLLERIDVALVFGLRSRTTSPYICTKRR